MITLVNNIKKGLKEIREYNLSVFAAGSSFYWILSAVPIIIVASSIIPYFGITEKVINEFLNTLIPERMREFKENIVEMIYTSKNRVLPVAFMIAAWSAGKGMLSIIRGLQVIYQIDEYRSYLKLRMMASFYTILTMVGFLFSLLVLVFGQKIYRIFLMDIPLFQGINRLLQYGRFLTTILVLGIIFSGLYAFVPGKDIKRKKSLLWGFLAAISCTAFSFGFSLYINGWKSPVGYGNIRYIIMIMLWLYGNIYIVLFWAYLQKTYEKWKKEQEKTGRRMK